MVHLDLDTDRREVGDVLSDHIGGQAIVRDRQAESTARDGRRLEHIDLVAAQSEMPRGGDTGRTRTHDGDAFAVRLLRRDSEQIAGRVVRVGHEALDAADRHWAFEAATRAAVLTGGEAGSTEAAHERRALEHEVEGLLVLTAARK